MREERLISRIVEGLKDMCYIWAKEMRSTITDEGVLIFFILVPLLYPLLYSWIYTNEVVREVPVAVVDMSYSQLSREYLRQVDASPDVDVLYHCNNLDEARQLIGKQVVKGVIYLPSDFSNNIGRGEQSTVEVYCDMSLMLTYKAIFQTSQAVATKINSRIQIQHAGGPTARDDELTIHPLEVDEVPIFNSTVGYGNSIIPAVLLLILQQTLLLGIGLSAGTARESNRYRDLVPIGRHYNGIFRIVLGKAMCYFMIGAVMGAYITCIVPKLFGYTTMVTPFQLLALMVPFILSSIFFGMTVSCMVRYRENVILLVVFMSLPLLFVTGISWPESNIPGLWRGVSWLFPSTFGVKGFLKMSSMGGSLGDIGLEYQALWVLSLIYFFITCLVYRFQLKQTRMHAIEQIEKIQGIIRKTKKIKQENTAL